MATANMNFDAATATVTTLTSSSVTVRSSGVRSYWFAPVLGFDSTTINADATAAWGAPTGGTAVLPLTFSYCEFLAQVDTTVALMTDYFPTGDKAGTPYSELPSRKVRIRTTR